MLAVTPIFEVSISSTARGNTGSPAPSPVKNAGAPRKQATPPGQLSAQDVSKIIERNSQGPEARAVVNINPSSAADMSKQSANSASSAANRYSQQSTSAGQRQNSLSSGYVTKPTRVPGRVNMNPTFTARS